MSLENNDKNNYDFNEFLQSLQEDNTKGASGKEDAFPFADSFDIDSFVKENALPPAEISAQEPKKEDTAAPAQEKSHQDFSGYQQPSNSVPQQSSYADFNENSYRYQNPAREEVSSYEDDFSTPSYANTSYEGGQSLRHLEQKISELESSFVDVN